MFDLTEVLTIGFKIELCLYYLRANSEQVKQTVSYAIEVQALSEGKSETSL